MATRVHSDQRWLSRRAKQVAPWAAGLVLLAGIVVAIVAFVPNKNAAPQTLDKSANPPAQAPKPKTVPLGKDTTAVARQFLKTAVARQDLDAAWRISGPNIRGGLTHKEWMTGNIPVIPYPLKSLAVARFKVDWSHANEAALEVALLPKDNAKVKAQIFFIRLDRVGQEGNKHWIVESWVPRSAPLVPQSAG